MTIMMPHEARVVAKLEGETAGVQCQGAGTTVLGVRAKVKVVVTVMAVLGTVRHQEGMMAVDEEEKAGALLDRRSALEMEKNETGLDLPETHGTGAGAGTNQLPRRSKAMTLSIVFHHPGRKRRAEPLQTWVGS